VNGEASAIALREVASESGLLSPASCLALFVSEADLILDIAGNDWYPSEISLLVGKPLEDVLIPIGGGRTFRAKSVESRVTAELSELHLTRAIALTGLAIRTDSGGGTTVVFVPVDSGMRRGGDGGAVDGLYGTGSEANGTTPLSYGQLNFLALMSHELRTPLNAIVGFAELIQAQPHGPIGDSKYLDYVQDIWDAGSYLSRIVSDLLVLGRVGLSSEDLRLDAADLRDCVMSAVRFNRHVADQRSIGVVTQLDPIPMVMVDEKKIIQALTNVIGNAIKYSHNNEKVEVQLSRDESGDIFIRVADRGIGICQKDLAQVFEPFVRSQNAKELNIQGAGIGLAVVRSIVRAHGGDVGIESVERQGTTVTLTLPRDVIADQAPEVAPWEISE